MWPSVGRSIGSGLSGCGAQASRRPLHGAATTSDCSLGALLRQTIVASTPDASICTLRQDCDSSARNVRRIRTVTKRTAPRVAIDPRRRLSRHRRFAARYSLLKLRQAQLVGLRRICRFFRVLRLRRPT